MHSLIVWILIGQSFEDLHSMHWGNGNGVNDGYPEWHETEPDFNDFVIMVESPDPADPGAPEPATIFLLGLGLVGMVGFNRKRLMD